MKKEDLLRLQADYQWLNDSLVNAGQALICEKFPNVKGLQNVNLSRTLSFKLLVRKLVVAAVSEPESYYISCIICLFIDSPTILCKSSMMNN